MATDFTSEAYDAHSEQLRRYLTAITHDRDLADDLAQDAYIRLAQEVGLSRAPRDTHAWLRRVGRNLVIDRGRRQQVAIKVHERLRDEGVGPSAEEEFLHRENRRELGRVLAQINSVDRTALQMAAEGYSGAEIAQVLNISEGALRTRMSRARSRLRLLLGPVS